MVIMVIMLVLVGELLCQDSRSWSSVLENLPTRSVWVCGYFPSCSTLNGVVSQKPSGRGACLTPKGPQVIRWGPHRTNKWQDSVNFVVTGESPVWFAPESSSF
jgi:hypothetical protein